MKAKKGTVVLTLALAAVAAAAHAGSGVAAPATVAQRGVPRVEQMVVFRNGGLIRDRVVARRTSVDVGSRACAVAAATPLAALLAIHPPKVRFKDYGSCSGRPGDSSGLFVKSMRGQANHRLNGWVYKVGRKLGTAGAADPSGPFGDGRLRSGARVVWFYCVFHEGSCQRSLELSAKQDGDRLTVSVRGYDDEGESVKVGGARVVALRQGRKKPVAEHEADADGVTSFDLASGGYTLHATRSGMIRAFPVEVAIP